VECLLKYNSHISYTLSFVSIRAEARCQQEVFQVRPCPLPDFLLRTIQD
jgi:hypothetical protein